jgi:ribosome-associated toxin RatA of RatAB toxin-antitoxin module
MQHVGCMTVLNLTWFRAQSSPFKGKDNTWQFSSFEGDASVMKDFLEYNFLNVNWPGRITINLIGSFYRVGSVHLGRFLSFS